MPEMTPAMKKKLVKLEAQAETVAGGRESPLSEPPAPVGLKIMLKRGQVVTVEGATGEPLRLEVGRILLKDHEKFQELSSGSFDMIALLALANSHEDAPGGDESGDYDMEKMAFIINTILRAGESMIEAESPAAGSSAEAGGAPRVTAEECAAQVNAFAMQPISPETQSQMSALVALILSRKHPDITAGQVSEWLDLTGFLAITRAFYRINTGIRNRF